MSPIFLRTPRVLSVKLFFRHDHMILSTRNRTSSSANLLSTVPFVVRRIVLCEFFSLMYLIASRIFGYKSGSPNKWSEKLRGP